MREGGGGGEGEGEREREGEREGREREGSRPPQKRSCFENDESKFGRITTSIIGKLLSKANFSL